MGRRELGTLNPIKTGTWKQTFVYVFQKIPNRPLPVLPAIEEPAECFNLICTTSFRLFNWVNSNRFYIFYMIH